MQMVMLIIQIFLYQKKKTYHDVKNLETGNTKNQPRSTF